MSDQSLERTTAFAIHDNTTQWLSEPSASKVFIEPLDDFDLRASPEHQGASRATRMLPGGEHLADARGIQVLDHGDLPTHCEGLSGGGAGDGVDASTLGSTVWSIIELFGAAQSGIGGLTHASDAGTGTTVALATGEAAGLAAQDAVLVKGTASGKYQAREVVSKSTDDLTVDRALTDDAGAADTADEGEVVYASRSVLADHDVTEVANLAFFQSGDNWDREAFGCFPSSAQLQMEDGEILRLVLGGLRSSVWNKTLTSGALSRTDPTTGFPVICAPLILHIGNNRMVGHSFNFDFGLNISPRRGPADNNRLGFVRKAGMPKLTGTFSQGALTAPQEITEALKTTYDGAEKYSVDTQDVSLQIGDQPGACWLIRMPAARVRVTGHPKEEGLDMVSLEMTGVRASTAQGVSSWRIHCF